jgi:uncharacterized ion transporter superfamily protein YfcC
VLTLLVPSTSGLAALTMPVLAPLADFAGWALRLDLLACVCRFVVLKRLEELLCG